MVLHAAVGATRADGAILEVGCDLSEGSRSSSSHAADGMGELELTSKQASKQTEKEFLI